MIIQINATVCAAVDHGEDWRYKTADSDRRMMTLGGQGGAVSSRNNEIRKAIEVSVLAHSR